MRSNYDRLHVRFFRAFFQNESGADRAAATGTALDHLAETDLFDIAIIGGGVNGTGIARDAAGRGWRVFLCEQRDLASGTSSASTKLIHGGLRYLEYYEFRLVREALREREVLWRIAPHIVWPLRFVLPFHRNMRPAWLLRLGLLLYDNLGGRKKLPPTRTVSLRDDPIGQSLKPAFKRGFEYSDCWVEDSRLVALNALDAFELGAEIATRTACVSARRENGAWTIGLRADGSNVVRTIRARTLVNAAGPWVSAVADGVIGGDARAPIRLVQGSHIVVPRVAAHNGCYIFQNADKRIFFVIPYETDYTLIGTTDLDYHGDPAAARASTDEIDYLCRSASEYLATPVTPAMVVWTYSGVRPLHDEGKGSAQAVTRDYVLTLDVGADKPPLMSIFGGKITTFRKLAESVLAQLGPHLPTPTGRAAGWTGTVPLPGGEFPMTAFDETVAALARDYPFLPHALARRLVRAYGTRARALLGDAASMADLGRDYGAGLTDAELRYLAQHEWARTADDVVWRRSKLGIRLDAAQIASIDAALRAVVPASRAA